MFADAIIAIIFIAIAAAALACNADKIEDWRDSVQEQDLSWRD